MNRLLFFASGLLLFLLASPQTACYYDNEVDQYGAGTCDTTNTRFSVEITNLLNDQCRSCHTQGGSASPAFDTYDEVKDACLNGNLLIRINDGASPMPQTGLMSVCNRSRFQAWVNAGALNN